MRQVSGVLGRAGSFRACFGLPEQLIPDPENIKSGLNRALRPPYGLILAVRGAMGPRMSLEALENQKPFKSRQKTMIFMIFGLYTHTHPGHAFCYMVLFSRCGAAG